MNQEENIKRLAAEKEAANVLLIFENLPKNTAYSCLKK